MKPEREREWELMKAFPRAIEKREFMAYIQPKYNIYEQKFYGGEVLCRWKYKGEMVSPGEFIPIFEQHNLIMKLDRYMFIETLKILRSWIKHHIKPMPLSVNLSRINFYNKHLSEELLSLIDEFGIPHSLIQIEITESAYTELEQEVIRFVDYMREQHIEVLMDDFGSGYSSLNVLKDMNISILKVDYRFLNHSRIKNRREQILESIVKMARTIEVPIIVEGVEKESDVIFLKGLGVRYVQGFLYGKPMPVSEFEKIPRGKNQQMNLIAAGEMQMSQDFFDLDSTAHMIYENSFSGMAVCETSGDKLYFVQMNKKLQNSLELNLYDLKHKRVDLLSLVIDEDRDRVLEYFHKICMRQLAEEWIEVRIRTAISVMTIRMKFYLLSQIDKDFVLLLQIEPLKKDMEYTNTTELFAVLDKLDRGYYILNENHTILYSNPQARKLLPHFIPGAKCTDYKRYDEDCSQCPLDNYDKLLSYYSQNLDTYVENYITEIQVNNQSVKLVRIDETGQKVLGNEAFVMRMNYAMARERDVYTEVNLDTEQYTQITFAKRKIFDIPAIGHYKESFADMIEKMIDPATNKELVKYFSLEGMQREFADGKTVTARFRFAQMEAWAEVTGTFMRDEDVRYCCVYTKDITRELQNEYDSLTNLLTGNAVKQIINDYFVEQSSEMAAMLRLDFDDFQKVNHTYDYLFGDKVLAEFAKMLQEYSSENYSAARLGGVEFLIFIPDLKAAADLDVFSRKILEESEKLLRKLEIDQLTGVKLRSALYPKDGQTFIELYRHIDFENNNCETV